jgi:hypothetical protein
MKFVQCVQESIERNAVLRCRLTVFAHLPTNASRHWNCSMPLLGETFLLNFEVSIEMEGERNESFWIEKPKPTR